MGHEQYQWNDESFDGSFDGFEDDETLDLGKIDIPEVAIPELDDTFDSETVKYVYGFGAVSTVLGAIGVLAYKRLKESKGDN
jgi:hypothetical protein